jgi:hypothetical protein
VGEAKAGNRFTTRQLVEPGCIGHIKDSLLAAAETTLGDVGVSLEVHIATDEPHAACGSAGHREPKSRDEESNKDLGKVLEVVGMSSECYSPFVSYFGMPY